LDYSPNKKDLDYLSPFESDDGEASAGELERNEEVSLTSRLNKLGF